MVEINNVTYAYRVSDMEGNKVLRTAVKNLNLKICDGEFLVLTNEEADAKAYEERRERSLGSTGNYKTSYKGLRVQNSHKLN